MKRRLAAGTVIGHYGRTRAWPAPWGVYLATDSRLGRQVALKALAPHLTGDASTVNGSNARPARPPVQAPNLHRLRPQEIDGHLFIARSWSTATPPRGNHDRQPAPRQFSRPPGWPKAGSAHAKGITHRDFAGKRDARPDGQAQGADFGLARSSHAVTPLSSSPAGALATLPGILVARPRACRPSN
jgi:hypothetical protein